MYFFTPIDQMQARIARARDDSNTTVFNDLLLLGEMVTKIVAAGYIAAIDDDRERHRYQKLYQLVRADGIGEWAQAIDDTLTGPAAQYLIPPVGEEQRQLTQALTSGTWQYDAVQLLNECVQLIDSTCEPLPTRVAGRRWFTTFARLRNKTRGHGATTGDRVNHLLPNLEQSITIMIDSMSLLKRPWMYLYPNLSGKYRLTKVTPSAENLESLKTKQAIGLNLPEGLYVSFDAPGECKYLQRVELVHTTIDTTDFFFPNGGFTDKKYELLSYITDERKHGIAAMYLTPPSDLPRSETQGLGMLDVQGKAFGNLPPSPNDYIARPRLEEELFEKLMNDRHPVITMLGRGGIGKTWLALTVLHRIAVQERFAAILWFSARDIDLLSTGAKVVKPHILHEGDVADEFVRLMQPSEARTKGFKNVPFLMESLARSQIGPILFIFDNFETVRSPAELFAWLDTNIRLPNKILITTRHRDFKGDYPVDVTGMELHEAESLLQQTSEYLGIQHLLTQNYCENVLDEADGHPYVIKILLGEVAKAAQLVKVERLIASKDDLLDALFERTYASLMPVSKRVFLTLCSWRSIIPQIALEAVLLRPVNERMDVRAAVEELGRSSFIEVRVSEHDEGIFLSVPLVAMLFGQRKLAVDPAKSAIDADIELLRWFGAARQSDIQHGVSPRIERLFRTIAERISTKQEDIASYAPMLEYIARQYSRAWLLLADLYEEIDGTEDDTRVKRTIGRYLETSTDTQDKYLAWDRLARLHRRSGDTNDEVHALVARAELSPDTLDDASYAANAFSAMVRDQRLMLDTDEKRVLVQRIATIMEQHVSAFDAIDCSRLAWLYMHLQQYEKAKIYTAQGLEIDPSNEHCLRLSFSLR